MIELKDVKQNLTNQVEGSKSENTAVSMISESKYSRTFSERVFSPILVNSMRGNSLILYQTALGLGAMAIPALGKTIGIFGQLILLIIGWQMAKTLLFILAKMSFETRSKSYEELIFKITKSKIMVVFYYITIIPYGQGLVGMLNIILINLIITLSNMQLGIIFDKLLVTLIISTLSFLMSLFKDSNSYKQFGMLSAFSVFQLYSVFLIKTILVNDIDKVENINYIGGDIQDQCNGISVVFFAQNSFANVHNASNNLLNPSSARFDKMINIANFALFFTYVFIFLSGYVCFIQYTPDNMIDILGKSENVFIQIGTFLMLIYLFTSPLMMANPLRDIFFNLMDVKFKDEISQFKYVLVTAINVYFPVFIVFQAHNIIKVLNIVGGIAVIFFGFGLPVQLYNIHQQKKKEQSQYRMYLIISFVIIGSACIVSIQLSFLQLLI